MLGTSTFAMSKYLYSFIRSFPFSRRLSAAHDARIRLTNTRTHPSRLVSKCLSAKYDSTIEFNADRFNNEDKYP